MKQKLFLFLCTLLTMIGVQAQTDVTATYITNPSFENDDVSTLPVVGDKSASDDSYRGWTLNQPTGWTVTGTDVTKQLKESAAYTDNGYGKVGTISNGNYCYYFRHKWGVKNIVIKQTLKNLPAGQYTLSADIKAMKQGGSPKAYLSAGSAKSSDVTFASGGAGLFTTTEWTTPQVSFNVNSISDVEIALNVEKDNTDNAMQIAFDNFILTYEPFANAADYAALNEAIEAAEDHQAGFEVEEYAPYTNKDAFVVLANAKAINPDVPNVQSTVQGATAALTSAIWTANVARMNAFYRGNFSDYVTGDISGDNRAVATGWSNTNTYECGVVGLQSIEPAYSDSPTENPGLAGLTSKKALYLRGGYSTAYGSTPGYTVPLKANAIYTLSFTYGGWGQYMNNAGTVKVKDGSSTDVLEQSVTTTGTANSDKTKWQSFNAEFKTNEAGNYTVDLNFVAGGQSAFSDFSLLFQNYMVKASATELPAGNMTADTWYYFDIATEVEYKLTASSNLGDIKYVTDGTLAENTSGTAFSVDANNVVNLTVGRYYVKSSSTQSLTVAVYAIATPEDYENLNAAINAAENNIGFEDGEYAPYNNKEMLTTLAEAKAIDQSVDNPQATVQGYTTALAAANWTANDGEVNAVFDGTFATYDTDAATPKGWTSNGANLGGAGNSRVFVKTSGDDYTYLTKYFGYGRGMYLRFDGNGKSSKASVYTYGTTQGYTMPLKANTIYRMQIKAGGWDGRATSSEIRAALVDKNGTEIMGQTEDTPSLHAGSPDACVTYDYYFVVTTAGDYSLKITNPGDKEWCIIIGSIDLKSAAELPFSDAAAMPKYAPGTYPRVSVSRTLNTGENVWNTLVLPFDYTNADWAVRELSSSTEDNLSFSVVEGGAMTAGKPYLVRPNAAVTSIEAENVAVITTPAAVETEKYSFIPVFAPTTITGDGTNYFVATGTNKLYCAKADINTNGYRAYFHYTGENSGARSVFLNFDETDPTAINAIEAAEVESGALKDGKYLIGNKVVLVKNGVKYGTNGQKLN